MPGAGFIDLGNEPPLAVGRAIEPEPGEPSRGSVSIRWLSGTILTGLTSTILMGGALLAALSGGQELAAAPRPIQVALASGDGANGRKSDRIRPVEAEVVSREILQVSTISRDRDRDLIKTRPFVSIHATLSTRTDLAGDIPPYDPVALVAEAADEEPTQAPASSSDQIYGAKVDGEVAVKVTAFPLDAPELASAGDGLQTAEVEEIVRDASRFIIDGGVQLAALPFVDPGRFTFDEEDDPFAALGVRIIPENVSFVAKSDAEAEDPFRQDRILPVEPRKDLTALLTENEVDPADADAIVAAMGQLIDLSQLGQSDRVRVAFAPSAVEGGAPMPLRVSIYDEGVHQATVARTDGGQFVRADEPEMVAGLAADADAEGRGGDGRMPRLYEAIYETALEQQVPEPLIKQLIRIFAYDVDFQSPITPGDSIEIFHSTAAADDPAAEEDGIVYAALTLNGVAKRYYRYQTSDDGVVDFYDDEGRSAKKFLMRKPMTIGSFRSGFGYRVHPILGTRRLHTGVDWAAPSGTPIMASGDGVVVSAGWTSGYGRYTRIRHSNGYETAYGHQSGFAKGIVPGAHVRQGQVIGYVGSTGLSTGPHLHYEVRINNKLVDPLRIKLPRGRVLQGDILDAFERERSRIDTLLGNTPAGPQRLAANP